MILSMITLMLISLLLLFDKARLLLWTAMFALVFESVEIILLLVVLC